MVKKMNNELSENPDGLLDGVRKKFPDKVSAHKHMLQKGFRLVGRRGAGHYYEHRDNDKPGLVVKSDGNTGSDAHTCRYAHPSVHEETQLDESAGDEYLNLARQHKKNGYMIGYHRAMERHHEHKAEVADFNSKTYSWSKKRSPKAMSHMKKADEHRAAYKNMNEETRLDEISAGKMKAYYDKSIDQASLEAGKKGVRDAQAGRDTGKTQTHVKRNAGLDRVVHRLAPVDDFKKPHYSFKNKHRDAQSHAANAGKKKAGGDKQGANWSWEQSMNAQKSGKDWTSHLAKDYKEEAQLDEVKNPYTNYDRFIDRMQTLHSRVNFTQHNENGKKYTQAHSGPGLTDKHYIFDHQTKKYKRVRFDEETQLDEISRELKNRYLAKAKKSRGAAYSKRSRAYMHNIHKYDDASDVIDKRNRGLKMAKEETQLAEVHNEAQLKTAIERHRDGYVNHVSKAITHNKIAIKHLESGNRKAEDEHDRQSDYHNRVAGKHDMALNRAQGLLDRIRANKSRQRYESVVEAHARPSYTRIGKSNKKPDDLSGETLTVAALNRLKNEKSKNEAKNPFADDISRMAGSVFGAMDKHGKVNVKKQRELDMGKDTTRRTGVRPRVSSSFLDKKYGKGEWTKEDLDEAAGEWHTVVQDNGSERLHMHVKGSHRQAVNYGHEMDMHPFMVKTGKHGVHGKTIASKHEIKMKEETEINELSKATLKRYANRAEAEASSRMHAYASYAHGESDVYQNAAKHHAKKTEKRISGLAQAVRRLAKEDVNESNTPHTADIKAKYYAFKARDLESDLKDKNTHSNPVRRGLLTQIHGNGEKTRRRIHLMKQAANAGGKIAGRKYPPFKYTGKYKDSYAEETQLDEVSSKTLYSYANQAANSIKYHNDDRRRSFLDKDVKNHTRKTINRASGIAKALTQAPVKREAELHAREMAHKATRKTQRDDYFAKHGKADGYHGGSHFIKRVKNDEHAQVHIDAAKKEHGSLRVRGRLGKDNPHAHLYKQGGPLHRSSSQDYKRDHSTHLDLYKKTRYEEYDQLDEISKATALSYIQGASIDKSYKAMDHDRMNHDGTRETQAGRDSQRALGRKHGNRSGGIQLAAAKLAGDHQRGRFGHLSPEDANKHSIPLSHLDNGKGKGMTKRPYWAKVAATEETQIDELYGKGKLDDIAAHHYDAANDSDKKGDRESARKHRASWERVGDIRTWNNNRKKTDRMKNKLIASRKLKEDVNEKVKTQQDYEADEVKAGKTLAQLRVQKAKSDKLFKKVK